MSYEPATIIRVRNLVTDARRQQVGEFFDEHIPAKYKALPVLMSDMGDQYDMQVAAIADGANVMGAIYWGRDFEDEIQLVNQGKGILAEAMGQEVRILQNIAVSPSARGSGVGRRLNEHMEKMLTMRGIRSVVGVATGDTGPFFASLGYHVYEPWERLRIGLFSVKAMIDLPIEGDDVRWFAKSLSV